jgi:hypothetical protein
VTMARYQVLKVLAVIVAMTVCAACDPVDRRPGTWLSGQVTPTPDSWDFTDAHQEIFVETATWYGVPHSVTTVVASADGWLYVPSIYEEPVPFPGSKRWNRNIASDPEVRLQIGDNIYLLRAQPVTNEDEFERGFIALAGKYPFWNNGLQDPTARPPFVIIKIGPRS